MLSKQLLLPSLTTLLLFHGQLLAEEQSLSETAQPTMQEHVVVGSRKKDPSVQQDPKPVNPAEESDSKESAEGQQAVRRISNKIANSENQFMLAPRHMSQPQYALASYVFPAHFHRLMGIVETPYTIEIVLEDDSHWEVAASDVPTLRTWRREHDLTIKPNYSWFCNEYEYYIINKYNNTYVKADLTVGPERHGHYSHWITDIDKIGGHVCLENQMVWCIDPQDRDLIFNWAVNDHVILGVYESWFSPYDRILINVNMDAKVRAKQY